MAQTAERLADQYNLPRAEVDAVALRSQQRAKEAWDAGAFDEEAGADSAHRSEDARDGTVVPR